MSYFIKRVNYPEHGVKVNFTIHVHNLKHHTGLNSKMSPTLHVTMPENMGYILTAS